MLPLTSEARCKSIIYCFSWVSLPLSWRANCSFCNKANASMPLSKEKPELSYIQYFPSALWLCCRFQNTSLYGVLPGVDVFGCLSFASGKTSPLFITFNFKAFESFHSSWLHTNNACMCQSFSLRPVLSSVGHNIISAFNVEIHTTVQNGEQEFFTTEPSVNSYGIEATFSRPPLLLGQESAQWVGSD